MAADHLPVGTILAYAADETLHLLSQGWGLCNGVSVNRQSYPELFNAIGYSNGKIGDDFLLPDLGGRFLRGADDKNVPGKVADFTTSNPGFKVTIKNIPYTWNLTNLGDSGTAAWHMDDWNSDSQSFTVNGGDNETRPVNIYFQFIIKMTSTAGIGSTPVSIPTGSVIPYAASDNSPVDPDRKWILCSGNQYRVAAYRDLFGVIGSRFSNSTGEIFFNVPLLQGIFLRGADPRMAQDPDAFSRFPPADGTTGPVVGSLQRCATSSRGLTVRVANYPQSQSLVFKIAGHDNLYDKLYSNDQSWSGGARETRPRNAAVQYLIASTSSPADDAFPLGGIIAIPGQFVPATQYWAAADGRELSKANYSDLYAALQDVWGPPSSADKFVLPNLNGMFLRATDLSGSRETDEWGDPDRAARKTATGSKTSAFGTGSYQDYATALPRNAFNIGISNPRDDQDNAATAVGRRTAAYNSGYTDFVAQGGETEETAPRSVSVAFYVKIKAA